MFQNKVLVISVIGIFLLASIFRSFKINSVVPILNRDEAALGYNALLLKETGRDEWGVRWPISPRSFGDSKLIGYPMLLVGLFQLLPAEDWVVRLPAIFAGSLLPLLVFFFARTLGISKRFALFAALSVAVNPVFVHFSRFAYEAMVALTYFIAATTLVLYQVKNSKYRISLDLAAALLFFASLLTYNTPLLLLPLFIPLLILHRGILPVRKWLFTTIILSLTWLFAVVLLFPMLSQKSGIAIFSDQTYIQNYPQYRASFIQPLQPILGNSYVYFAIAIIKHTFQSFSPNFLVLSGGSHPWHSLLKYGHISWIIYFGAIMGIVTTTIAWLKHRKRTSKNVLFLILFILVSLVPASITVDAPHATRSLLFFVLLVVMASYFYQLLLAKIRFPLFGQYLKQFALFILFITTLIGGLSFFTKYLGEYPIQASRVYQTGFHDIISTLELLYPNTPVAVLDPGGFQYILLAWYNKTSASDFSQSIIKQQPNTIGLQYGESLGRYHFIVQAADRSPEETILIFWDVQSNKWQYQTL